MSSKLVVVLITLLIVVVSAEETQLRKKRQLCSCMRSSCSCLQITITLRMSCSCPQIPVSCPCTSGGIFPSYPSFGIGAIIPVSPIQCQASCNDVCQRQCVAGQCVPVCWNACNQAC